MRRDSPTRASLRAATAHAHARVDQLFSSFDLASRAGYARFLQAQAAALLPLEQALEAGGALAPELDWPARRRADALLRDLRAWDLPVPEGEPVVPIAGTAAVLGTLYVLEGSRLGGAVIRRAIPGEFPQAFLAPGPRGLWPALLAMLETDLPTDTQRDEALAAALAAFALFERSARALAPEIA
jgi:heme oxygenase